MSRPIFVGISITILSTAFALAETPAEGHSAQVQAGAVDSELAEQANLVQPKLSPMQQEIADMQKRGMEEVAALAQKFQVTTDAEARFALQRRIETAKRDMLLQSLEIQLRYAQTEGREDAAAKLQQAIEQIESPGPVAAKPVDRSRPADAPQR